MSLFHVEAYGPVNWKTQAELVAFNARTALFYFRAWQLMKDVEYVTMSIASLEPCRWPIADQRIGIMQYRYNGLGAIMTWRQVKHWKTPAWAERWPFTKKLLARRHLTSVVYTPDTTDFFCGQKLARQPLDNG